MTKSVETHCVHKHLSWQASEPKKKQHGICIAVNRMKIILEKGVYLRTQMTLVGKAVLQCGPRHIRVYTAKRVWLYTP